MNAECSSSDRVGRWASRKDFLAALAILMASLSTGQKAQAQGYYSPPAQQPPVYYYYGSPYGQPVPDGMPARSRPQPLRNYNERPAPPAARLSRQPGEPRSQSASRRQAVPATREPEQPSIEPDSQISEDAGRQPDRQPLRSEQATRRSRPERQEQPETQQQEEQKQETAAGQPAETGSPSYQPASAYSYPDTPRNTPVLNVRRGASVAEAAPAPRLPAGEHIRQAQEQLRGLGYDPGTADGVLGSRTEAALREFQKSQSIEENNVLGARTLEALKAAAGRQEEGDSVIERTVISKLMNYSKSVPGAAAASSSSTDTPTTAPEEL